MINLKVNKTYVIGQRAVGFKNSPVIYTTVKILDKTQHTSSKASYAVMTYDSQGIKRISYFWDVPDTERQFSMRIVSAEEVCSDEINFQ